jgi:uncharacterized protein YeaO (DUF488 family)
MKIRIKRVYEAAEATDGARILVDRLWPRGLSKADAKIDVWVKEAAPSNELRRWFGHEPERWEEFQRRYFAELDQIKDLQKTVLPVKGSGTVTLLFGAKDEEHNNAVALKKYLQGKPSKKK